MIRSISIDVTAAASVEQLEDFFSGLEGKTRRVTEIWCEQLAETRLRAYLEQEQIVDVSLECDQVLTRGVPVDLVVPVGSTFKAGIFDESGSGGTAFVTVFYDET